MGLVAQVAFCVLCGAVAAYFVVSIINLIEWYITRNDEDDK